jgi:hypothetical protein
MLQDCLSGMSSVANFQVPLRPRPRSTWQAGHALKNRAVGNFGEAFVKQYGDVLRDVEAQPMLQF